MSFVLGVDIGGSHITAAWVDLTNRIVLADTRIRKSVNASGSVEEILQDWYEVILAAGNTMPGSPLQIGIAMPGPFNYEEGISLIQDQDKFKSLYGVNVKEALANRLTIETDCIRFMNDAACFLQGEVFCGAAKNADHVLGLTLGTGLGSAVCNNGRAIDAELWQSQFKNGIAEDYFSTRWFVSRYHELSGKWVSGVKGLLNENNLPLMEQVFFEFSENMAAFLIPLIREYYCEAIVLGGNIARSSPYFLPELQRRFAADGISATIKKALLEEDAALIGAANANRLK